MPCTERYSAGALSQSKRFRSLLVTILLLPIPHFHFFIVFRDFSLVFIIPCFCIILERAGADDMQSSPINFILRGIIFLKEVSLGYLVVEQACPLPLFSTWLVSGAAFEYGIRKRGLLRPLDCPSACKDLLRCRRGECDLGLWPSSNLFPLIPSFRAGE